MVNSIKNTINALKINWFIDEITKGNAYKRKVVSSNHNNYKLRLGLKMS